MFLRSIMLERANEMLVSSAKITGAEVLFIILAKSFTYKRKSRSAKIEHCGTPCLTQPNLKLYYYSRCHYIGSVSESGDF